MSRSAAAAGSARSSTAGVREARGTPRLRRSLARVSASAALRAMTAICDQAMPWWTCSSLSARATCACSCQVEEARITSTPAAAAGRSSSDPPEESLADDGASNLYVQKVREYAKKNHSESFVISAQIEQEISELSDEEKGEYLESLGLSESGLDKIVRASYSLLGLMSYLTAGEKETRAWTIKKGTKAPQAAGKIHTDFERGFIKAEVVNYKDLLDNGSLSAAREKGLVRMEGKEYVMQDGDVVLFRFNV